MQAKLSSSLSVRFNVAALAVAVLVVAAAAPVFAADGDAAWKINTPIVTCWDSPTLTDSVADRLVEGGWNLVICQEAQLDVAKRHGLRAMLNDTLLNPASFDKPAQRAKLDALVDRVKNDPAMYSYFIVDEPAADKFPLLGRIVAYLRQRDPAHLAYINLLPTYGENWQFGTTGSQIEAYKEYLRLFIKEVHPALLSYDHYQFAVNADRPEYFLNLGLIRRTALDVHIPFLNIVQACSFASTIRIPGPPEERFLTYTTLAYGGQGISHFVYTASGEFNGGIVLPSGKLTPLYGALKHYNREFVAIAKELQPLRSLAVYHAGMLPQGTEPLPAGAAFKFDPPIAPIAYKSQERVRGFVLGYFGAGDKPSQVVVVNLDYKAEATVGIAGPSSMQTFDATSSTWSPPNGSRIELHLPPGGGTLIRIAK
jgi:hypothetical protein